MKLSDKIRASEMLRTNHVTDLLVEQNVLKEKDVKDKQKEKKEKKHPKPDRK